ncbi:lysophospholipid acyltransferase family protein [Candidatus Dependentiae bacterium]|nr:lysophospholipid acyltransferase family protein [Candidatus Dependentiae bacterium]MCG2756761.1 lysophospholipid acyltransferase family protein [Candidatus Dependentiae bacterium]
MILVFKCVGLITYTFSKKRKNIAIKNINACFVPKNSSDIKNNKKTIRKSFALLGQSLADFILVRFYKKDKINNYFKIKNLDFFKDALNKKCGVILSTAHFGSWELAAHFLALNGFKSFILYNPIRKSAWFEKIIKKNREFSGNTLIPKQNSLLTLYRHLKNGGIVLLASDQHAYSPDGREYELFGNRTFLHSAFIKLSLETNSPIVSGFVYTNDLFSYEMDICEPIYPKDYVSYNDPEFEILKKHTNLLENAIKKSPENWLWTHRRFKETINY